MKRCVLSLAAVGALSALSAQGSPPSEVARVPAKAQVPQTELARASAELISRVERAFGRYVTACAAGKSDGLAEQCAAIGGRDVRISNLWIYPTLDGESAFVEYDAATPERTVLRQLVLIEMNGERISTIHNFTDSPPTLTARTP